MTDAKFFFIILTEKTKTFLKFTAVLRHPQKSKLTCCCLNAKLFTKLKKV